MKFSPMSRVLSGSKVGVPAPYNHLMTEIRKISGENVPLFSEHQLINIR